MIHVGRKLYHLVGGLGLLAVYFILGRNRALIFYAVVFAVVLFLDLLRLKMPAINEFIFTKFGSFVRASERQTLTGTAPYVLGIGLSLLLYRADIASLAVCFLAFGDVAATTIGERYGRTKIGNKSLEGSLAFVVAAAAVGFLLMLAGMRAGYSVVLVGAVIAAGVELFPLPVNDNLAIPLVSGAAMTLIARLTGCA